MNKAHNLEYIWEQVPPDYYQKGIEKNFLQRLWHQRKLEAVSELIGDARPKSILDVGCASGWFLSQIARRFPKAKYIGVDVYKKAIQYAKEHYPSLKFMVADAHSLPFPANSCDIVICTEVLEHVLKPELVISEIKRILKPNGIAVIEMDTGNILFRTVWYWWTNLRKGVWKDSHLHSFNTEKLGKMINKDGLVISKKKIFNFSMAVAFRLEKKI